MSNVTLAIPDDLLEVAREQAQRQGTTLNALIREVLQRRFIVPGASLSDDAWSEEVRRLSVPGPGATPWTWNRDEIYDRAADRRPVAHESHLPYEAARRGQHPRTFIDTNVLVYAHDLRDPAKQERAIAFLTDLRRHDQGVMSTQVLNEFSSILLRKFAMPSTQVKAVLGLYAWADILPIREAHITEALDLVASHQLSYWDALMVAAALAANCGVLASEDLARSGTIRSLRLVNPLV
jgi:predicted nucleic acid-binding protein